MSKQLNNDNPVRVSNVLEFPRHVHKKYYYQGMKKVCGISRTYYDLDSSGWASNVHPLTPSSFNTGVEIFENYSLVANDIDYKSLILTKSKRVLDKIYDDLIEFEDTDYDY